MRFNHAKQTRELIGLMEKIIADVHYVTPAQFKAIRGAIVDDEMRDKVTNEIRMSGYVIKRI